MNVDAGVGTESSKSVLDIGVGVGVCICVGAVGCCFLVRIRLALPDSANADGLICFMGYVLLN